MIFAGLPPIINLLDMDYMFGMDSCEIRTQIQDGSIFFNYLLGNFIPWLEGKTENKLFVYEAPDAGVAHTN